METPGVTIDEIKREFGLRVRTLRKKKGLTQEQLADAVGKTVDTISNIERGVSSTRIDTAARLADALGVQLVDFFDFSLATASDRHKRRLMQDLLELVQEQDVPTIQAIIDQTNILVSVKSGP